MAPSSIIGLSFFASAALIGTAAMAQTVMEGGRKLQTTMTPGEETAAIGGDPNAAATGTAIVIANPGQRRICYQVTVSGITGTITAAHIHRAPRGVAAPALIGFTPPVGSSCIENLDRARVLDILKNPEDYYVNVHTDIRPAGAVRGQLAK
jgi:hypothetical protein